MARRDKREGVQPLVVLLAHLLMGTPAGPRCGTWRGRSGSSDGSCGRVESGTCEPRAGRPGRRLLRGPRQAADEAELGGATFPPRAPVGWKRRWRGGGVTADPPVRDRSTKQAFESVRPAAVCGPVSAPLRIPRLKKSSSPAAAAVRPCSPAPVWPSGMSRSSPRHRRADPGGHAVGRRTAGDWAAELDGPMWFVNLAGRSAIAVQAANGEHSGLACEVLPIVGQAIARAVRPPRVAAGEHRHLTPSVRRTNDDSHRHLGWATSPRAGHVSV